MSKYFEKYLDIAPLSHALWRSIEANELARVKRKIKYQKPVLDLGCGFGEFSGVFFQSHIEVGIDTSPTDLLKAAKKNKYKNLYNEDARNLSFKPKSFFTVVSISVLEHISGAEAAISEAHRVLKKNGYFIITVPTDELYTHLFYPKLLERFGAKWMARRYFRLLNKAFRHVNLWPKKKWESIIKKAGFEIVESKKFVSKTATNAFDIFLITALPSQLGRWITGERLIWKIGWKKRLLNKLFGKLAKEKTQSGSNIIIVAKKS